VHRSGRSIVVRVVLLARVLEGVGDRALEAQRAAFARGGIPRLGSGPCAGGLDVSSSLASTGSWGVL
jgi:hypothetical protein